MIINRALELAEEFKEILIRIADGLDRRNAMLEESNNMRRKSVQMNESLPSAEEKADRPWLVVR